MSATRRTAVSIALCALLVAIAVLGYQRCRASGDEDASGATSGAGGSGSSGYTRSAGGMASAPASVSGRVLRRSDRAPIAGAIVALARADFTKELVPDERPTLIATSAADGTWRSDAVAPGTYTVAATAQGFVPGTRERLVVGAGSQQTGVDLLLDAGGTILRGTVSDVGGGGVAGARVTVSREQVSPFDAKPELVAICGADGTYQMTLPDGSYTAVASHDDYTSASHEVDIAGQPVTRDFTLVPGGTIRGDVVTRDGKPVPHALVRASGGRGRRGREAQAMTDDSGKFALRSLGSGAISLSATARGVATSAPVVVEVGIGEQVDGIRIVVDRAFSISGRVVQKGTQTGIPNVVLGAFSLSGAVAIAPDPSGDDGSFEIVGVRPASYIVFAIGETVMPEFGKSVDVVDKDITGLLVEMEAGVTLSGRVEPPSVATLGLELDPSKIGFGNMFEAVKVLLVRGSSAADGTFALHHAPPGTFTLGASAADGKKGKLAVVVANVDQTNLVVKLEPRASIAGRVIDASGAAVAGVHVRARGSERFGKEQVMMADFDPGGATTAPDGSFKVVGLDAGKLHVSVADNQGQLAWADSAHKEKPREAIVVELADGQALTGMTLTVEARDGIIRGVVVGPDRKPAADAWVTAKLVRENVSVEMAKMGEALEEFRSSRMTPVLTGADGKFAFDHLRRGTYELVGEGARGSSRVSKPGIKTGDTSVTLELEPLGTLTGHVTTGVKAVTDYDLECKGQVGGPAARITRRISATDGAYSLERLAPGSYACTARSDDGTANGTVDVPAGNAKLELTVMPWASVSGIVVHAVTNQPVPNLHVVAGAGDDFDPKQFAELLAGRGVTTDAAGRFLVERVAPGKATVQILPPTTGLTMEHLASKEFVATSGQRTDVGAIKVIPPRTGDAGTFGMSTTVENGALVVSQVKPGGPADKAGVQAGDKIVAINNVPLPTNVGSGSAEAPLELAGQMLANGHIGVGETVQLALDRAGTPVQATLVSVRW